MLARPLIQAPLGKGRLAAVSRLRMSSRSMNWITGWHPRAPVVLTTSKRQELLRSRRLFGGYVRETAGITRERW
jgi:hypothetical protein